MTDQHRDRHTKMIDDFVDNCSRTNRYQGLVTDVELTDLRNGRIICKPDVLGFVYNHRSELTGLDYFEMKAGRDDDGRRKAYRQQRNFYTWGKQFPHLDLRFFYVTRRGEEEWRR